MRPDKFTAIHSLVGGAISSQSDGSMHYHDGQTPPSEAEIDTELIRLQAEYDALEYSRDRATSYPPIKDQLDMLYWDKVNGTDNWQDVIAKVKSDNPKP